MSGKGKDITREQVREKTMRFLPTREQRTDHRL